MKKSLVVLFLFVMAFMPVKAQDDRTDRLGVGVGPATMYGDNTGITREFKFKVLPAVTFDYHKKLHSYFDVRGSLGWQMVNSGDYYDYIHIIKIAESNLPHGFKGNAFYADVMPIFHINPNKSGYLPAVYKAYIGMGVGIAHVMRTDRYLSVLGKDLAGDGILGNPRSMKDSNTSVYVPFRAGVSKDFREDWEIALEPTMMLSFFGELDGNDQQQKIIKPDILFQFQFFLRRKLDF